MRARAPSLAGRLLVATVLAAASAQAQAPSAAPVPAAPPPPTPAPATPTAPPTPGTTAPTPAVRPGRLQDLDRRRTPSAGSAVEPAALDPSVPPGRGAARTGAPATGTAAAPGAAPGPGAAAGPAPGKASGDTTGLAQFEQGVEFEPRNPNYKVAFSLEDADLAELVRVIGQLTGKRFIFGGKVRNVKATIYSPQKITVAEAYQAFLSILETNGLSVVPHGRFLKIIEAGGAAGQGTPLYSAGQGAPAEDRYVTRLHRMSHVSADEVAGVLNKFKSKDADITTYAPGNLLIITDTGTNIRRLMSLVEEIDVGGAGDQVWIEPVHYGAATDLATRINDIFELKGGGGSTPNPKGGAPVGGGTSAGMSSGGELHVAKVVPDDRTNSLVIVATERAYLRILEFLKRIDIPQTGEGEIHVVGLQHAEATELAKTISEIVTGVTQGQAGAGAGGRGQAAAPAPSSGIFEGSIKVSADKSTNSLVVTSSPRDYAALRQVIDRLDQARRQVFIEAVVMDLAISRQSQLGVNFHGGAIAGDADNPALVYGGLNPTRTIGLPDPAQLQGMALGLRGPGITNSQNLLGTGISIPAFGAIVNTLATDSDSDVLSTPHILATDNVPAEINVGENVPLQQSFGGFGSGLSSLGAAAGGTAAAGAAGALGGLAGLGGFGMGSPQRQDVGTKIKIVPHLNESNEVRLELTEEISEARAPEGNLQVVPITKRTAQTQLVIKDQQTVVIGGLMRNRIAHSNTKIPILGDIPVLGALFRSSSTQMSKTNLVLILTPYIIRDQTDLRTIFERKMQERQEFLDRYFVFSEDNDYNPPKDYSRTNGAVEDIRQTFLQLEERRRLEELTKPKEMKTHTPGEPLQMPAPARGNAGGGAPTSPGGPGGAAPPPTPPGGAPAPPPLNVTPNPRSVDRVER